jgi:hypothetical protein
VRKATILAGPSPQRCLAEIVALGGGLAKRGHGRITLFRQD